MMNLGSYFLITVAILTTIPVLVFAFEIFAARFLPLPGSHKLIATIARKRVAILIPAHNEGSGILSAPP